MNTLVNVLKRRPYASLLILAAIVLLVGTLVWARVFKHLTVKVARVEQSIPEQVFGLGTVGARVQSNLGFKVPGVLTTLLADQGQRVRVGQPLAHLEASDVEAQLAVAKANVAQARANLDKADATVISATATEENARAVADRSAHLLKVGGVSEEQMQNDAAALRVAGANLALAHSEVSVAKAALMAADAQVSAQQATLGYYTLLAPYDGLIVSRNLELGSSPNPGQPVFTVVESGSIWVLAYVDERLAGDLRVGQPATITLRSEPGKTFPGHIARIEMQSDPVNEERLVDVAFDRLPKGIHLAEQAEAVIMTGQVAHAATVPPVAVLDLKDGKGEVWTVENGHLSLRQVAFGQPLLNGRLPILSGLPTGAAVVTVPVAGMRVGRLAKAVQEAGR